MALGDRLRLTLDRSLYTVWKLLGKDSLAYCQPMAPSGKGFFRCVDGSFLCLLELGGCYRHMTVEEEHQALDKVAEALRAQFTEEGRVMQVSFYCDALGGRRLGDYAVEDMKRSAKARQLELDFLLEDLQEAFALKVAHELVLIALWTLPGHLSPRRRKDYESTRKACGGLGTAPESAPLPFYNTELENAHEQYLNAVLTGFSNAGIHARLLPPEEAAWYQRFMVDPGCTSRSWRPDFGPVRQPGPKKGGLFFCEALPGSRFPHYFPHLGKELVPTDAHILEEEFVEIAGQLHCPLYMVLAPQQVGRFNDFLREVRKSGCSYRMTWNLVSKADRQWRVHLQKVLAQILSFSSSQNKKIAAAYRDLAEAAQHETLVGLRGIFDVWIEKGDKTAQEAASQLRRSCASFIGAVQAWGTQELRSGTGDPWKAFCASVPGFSLSSAAQTCIGPLRELMDMFPFFRPYSPWREGGLRRSPDGKAYHYQQNSSRQASWLSLVVAPMGGGKSVGANMENLEYLLLPGLTELPYLSILDFGASSRGVIYAAKFALPREQQHLAVYAKLRNEERYAVNIFDTPLCCMKPSTMHKGFLVDFLSLLCTPLEKAAPPDGVPAFLTFLVDKLYAQMAGPGGNLYAKGLLPPVDEALAACGLGLAQGALWHEVAAALFMAGRLGQAQAAHRRAMPLLSTLIGLCHDLQVVQGYTYGSESTGHVPVNEFVGRKLRDALEEYPIFRDYTKFSLGEARLISLDLEEVAQGGNAVMQRQAGVFYMFAYQLSSGKFLEMEEDVAAMPAFIQPYHRKRIHALRSLPKKVCIDEFHRLESAGEVMSQVFYRRLSTTVRESRKHRLAVSLLSQSIEDFHPVFHEIASTVYIFGQASDNVKRKLADIFGMGEAGIALQHNIHRPGKDGAGFLAFYKTGERVYHLLMLTLGPALLWALSSTREDSSLRDRLYREKGFEATLSFLAQAYPGGVKSLVEQRGALAARQEVAVNVEEVLFQECLEEMTQRERLRSLKKARSGSGLPAP